MNLPRELRGIAPTVGDTWEWEPLDPSARLTVRVTQVRWDGVECKVESELLDGTAPYWNDLGRWVEATVLVTPASEVDHQ